MNYNYDRSRRLAGAWDAAKFALFIITGIAVMFGAVFSVVLVERAVGVGAAIPLGVILFIAICAVIGYMDPD